ncbi:MAG: hypothetical protein IJG86_05145 [Clostridia bacterium]|nr:hypothetical protein [Clostridia bacterium]
MSLTNFELTKSWENPSDFPTYEEEEAKVRADMQCLFDELADGINTLIEQLKKTTAASGASGIGISAITALPGYTNVQDALAGLATALDDAVISGIVPDNSITTPKIVDANVTTPKIADEAVTGSKLGAGSVTDAKCDFSSGLTVAGDLTQQGKIILDSDCYGDTLPATAEAGRLFFLKVQ